MKMIAMFFTLGIAPICCLAEAVSETGNPSEAILKRHTLSFIGWIRHG
jgi:hypothetical protein